VTERRARIARNEPLKDYAVVVAVLVESGQRNLLKESGSRGFGCLRKRRLKKGAASAEENKLKALVGLEEGSLCMKGGGQNDGGEALCGLR